MPSEQRPPFAALSAEPSPPQPAVQILVALGDEGLGLELVEALASVGLRAQRVAHLREGLAAPLPAILVTDDVLPGAPPLELLRELRQRWPQLESLALLHEPDFHVARQAFALGAHDVLPAPFEVDAVVEQLENLVDQVESCDEHEFSFRGAATEATVRAALRAWLAHLCQCGIGSATRARAVSALAEVLDNVRRHAYPQSSGEFQVGARRSGSSWTLFVRDAGVGFEQATCSHAAGLSRARALVEDLRVRSLPFLGTTVELRFEHQPLTFDFDGHLDLSESDYLEPAIARRLLVAARSGQPLPPHALPPALAVCVGRLLADDSAQQRQSLAG
jgi:DNA-binding NarL/FixJ family response regulator